MNLKGRKNERMKDHTISYVDLHRPDPLPLRLDEDLSPQGCRRLVL